MLRLIDRAAKTVEWLVVGLAAIGSLIIVVQMLWISYGVFMRYAIGRPDRMVTEATALLLFPVALLGLAYAMREDSYPRVTLLTDTFKPGLQKLVLLFNGLIMLLIGVFFSITTTNATLRAFNSGASSEILNWPRYMFWGVAAASLIVFTVYAALRLLQIALRPPPPHKRRPMMEWYEVALGLMGLLILLIALGLPIPFALAAASLPFLWQIQTFNTSLVSAQLKLWGVWINYILLAVPLFVFLGELISRSNIGANLYMFLHRGVPIRGSAAYGSIGACAGFGAVSGSSMVGSLTIGGVALPEMLRLGYGRQLASGVLAAGGTLSVLLPPSLILLFYGIVTDQSIGQLFMAGVIPGLMLASLFVIVVLIWARLRPQDVPDRDMGPRLRLIQIAVSLGPIIVIGGVITVSIYGGIATPTEAAAIAALVTVALAVGVGGLRWAGFVEALMATMRTMGYLGLLLSAGVLFGFVLNYYRVPQQFTALFLSFELSPYMVLAMVILFYIALGMFLEPVSMTFITLPVIIPLILAAGFDLIWFGIIYTITMEIAVLTPPVGLNLYVISGISRGKVSVPDVIVGALPFIGALVILVGVMIMFPQAALWLPQQVR